MPEPIAVDSSDAVRLAAYDFGGEGRDALLVHANGFCAAMFAPLAAALAPWHCVSFDARAHGHSSVPSGDLAWEGHRDDVLAVLDHFAVQGHHATGQPAAQPEAQRPIGIGHSMGGAALLLAEQLRPGTFDALWLYEPIVFPPMRIRDAEDVDANPLVQGALRRRDSFPSEDSAFANFSSKPPLDELSDDCLAAYVHHGFAVRDEGITLRCTPQNEAAGYRMGGRHGAWEALEAVKCPVVVARGRDDGMPPASVAALIVERLPHGTLEEHPELGHFGPVAEPELLARSIISFTAGI